MNPSTALATVLVDAMARLGVGAVVLSPGSRSAPLAYALHAAATAGAAPAGAPGGDAVPGSGLAVHVRVDERSAAFLALGIAKGSGGPTAVVTTSGTAVANLHPAVLEASHSGVPLLLVTADRPHELRGSGANQTTDQVGIFGGAVRWAVDLPAPRRAPGQAAYWRNLVARAVAAATGARTGDPGPVHLNVAFAEPLTPDAPADRAAADADWPDPLHGDAGLSRVLRCAVAADDGEPVLMPAGPRTVVVAGDGAGPTARRLAEAAGWPLLAEPSSLARGGPHAVAPYRLLLDVPHLGGRVERAVVLGRPTLSRPVAALLHRPGVEVVVVDPAGTWPDAGRAARLVAPAVRAAPGTAADARWLQDWRRAGAAAAAAVDAVLDAEPELTGPLVAREVAAALRPQERLVVGSSNPARDLDLTAPPDRGDGNSSAPRVLANRGVAGIDGMLSTASGVALACGGARALLGDLTFLHDVGGLLVGPLEQRPQLQVVVVNDGGGGIFGLLEHGEPRHAAVFERMFATGHTAGLGRLCAGYGVAHRVVRDVAGLRAALADVPEGTSVVEVPIDRAGARDLSARLAAAARAAALRLAPPLAQG